MAKVKDLVNNLDFLSIQELKWSLWMTLFVILVG